MKNKAIIWSSIIVVFLFSYVIVGNEIHAASKKIAEAGMKSSSDYHMYMTEDVYDKLYPDNRVHNYEKEYRASNHSYKSSIVPLHFFVTAKVTVKNRYYDGHSGFNEDVYMTLKWKKGKWIATRVVIPA